MSTLLRQALRRICLNSQWKFAIFWKLKNSFPMVLTWEDAYYDNDENFELFGEALSNGPAENIIAGNYVNDPLSLAVAKMSTEVYYLGDGIIGKLGVTGNHEWIFLDKFITNSWPYVKFGAINGWHAQLSAGVRTILVVAVLPLGVVQLGSLCKIDEDLELVSHIRNTFLSLEDISNQSSCSPTKPLLMPGFSKESHCSWNVPESLDLRSRTIMEEIPNVQPYPFCKTESNCHCSFLHQQSTFNMIGTENSTIEKLLGPKSWRDNKFQTRLSNCRNSQCWSENSDSTLCQIPSSSVISRNHGKSFTPLNFSASSELHEALGSAFRVDSSCDLGWDNIESEISFGGSEGIADSCLLPSFSTDNLLEAVVANAFQSANDDTSETSFCKLPSILPTCGIDQRSITSITKDTNTSPCVTNTNAPAMCISTSNSMCNGQLARSDKAVKTRKRARLGESTRPRPRDRQLIQDRIKELRELVPNGAKCSIDSLLERTVKHMLFLRCVAEHAETMKECAESKLGSKNAGILGSTCELGTSWVMEVRDEQEICPIVVENLNNARHFLVEFLCEECTQFLGVAEAVKNLGLTILKGQAEACGDKTRICFIVAGPKNRSIHRMDILWPLVNLLKAKISTC